MYNLFAYSLNTSCILDPENMIKGIASISKDKDSEDD